MSHSPLTAIITTTQKLSLSLSLSEFLSLGFGSSETPSFFASLFPFYYYMDEPIRHKKVCNFFTIFKNPSFFFPISPFFFSSSLISLISAGRVDFLQYTTFFFSFFFFPETMIFSLLFLLCIFLLNLYFLQLVMNIIICVIVVYIHFLHQDNNPVDTEIDMNLFEKKKLCGLWNRKRGMSLLLFLFLFSFIVPWMCFLQD